MDNFSKILWGFFFSAIGIAFGWTLNQLGQWLRARQNDKRNLKFVLYNLLETYFIFVRSDFDKFFQKVIDKVFLKIPIDKRTEEGKIFIHSIYSGILTNQLKPELLDELKIIEENYKNSIKTLASIDPLTAYYLSGKTNIIKRFDTIHSWFDYLKQEFPNDTNEIEIGVKKVLGILKPDIFNDTLIELENDIRNIAWKISPYIWLKTKKTVKRLKSNADEQLEKEIDKLLNKLSTMISGL